MFHNMVHSARIPVRSLTATIVKTPRKLQRKLAFAGWMFATARAFWRTSWRSTSPRRSLRRSCGFTPPPPRQPPTAPLPEHR